MQKGSLGLNKLDNKPDCFVLATKNNKLVYTTTLWTESCLTTRGIFWATKESQPYTCNGRRKSTMSLMLWLFRSPTNGHYNHQIFNWFKIVCRISWYICYVEKNVSKKSIDPWHDLSRKWCRSHWEKNQTNSTANYWLKLPGMKISMVTGAVVILVVAKLVFVRLTSYKNDYWQNSIIMHSSCSMHDKYFCGMYSTYIQQDVEVVCGGLHMLGTRCGKKICFCIEDIFWIDVSFF